MQPVQKGNVGRRTIILLAKCLDCLLYGFYLYIIHQVVSQISLYLYYLRNRRYHLAANKLLLLLR